MMRIIFLVKTISPNADIYRLALNQNRSARNLTGAYIKIVDSYQELSPVTLETNFEGISDLAIGPDCFLYIIY